MKSKTKINLLIHIVFAVVVVLTLSRFQYNAVTNLIARHTFESQVELAQSQLIKQVKLYIEFLEDSEELIRKEEPNLTDEEVRDLLIDELKELMYSDVYTSDEYAWVNEILDYNGGDNYAIRLVHPELRDTEGKFLSTNTQDSDGNLPYQAELDGINENGYVFHSYTFQVKSGEIKEKYTYSELYPKYNWVISDGISFDRLSTFEEKIREDISPVVMGLTALIVFFLFIGLLLFYKRILRREKENFEDKQRILQEMVDIDYLTKSKSRNFGTNFLSKIYEGKNKANYYVCMIDIDLFKNYNDTYGHAFGDKVLREFAFRIENNALDGDVLVRWGGDEFMYIAPVENYKDADELGDKLINTTHTIKIPYNEAIVNITCSIGISSFIHDDSKYSQVLKRADEALYQSKTLGRDQYCVE